MKLSAAERREEKEIMLSVAKAMKMVSEKAKTVRKRSDELINQQLKEEMIRLRPMARRLLYGETAK